MDDSSLLGDQLAKIVENLRSMNAEKLPSIETYVQVSVFEATNLLLE